MDKSPQRIALWLVPVLALAACANRTAYDVARADARRSCMAQPTAQVAACLNRVDAEFSAFEAEERRRLQEVAERAAREGEREAAAQAAAEAAAATAPEAAPAADTEAGR